MPETETTTKTLSHLCVNHEAIDWSALARADGAMIPQGWLSKETATHQALYKSRCEVCKSLATIKPRESDGIEHFCFASCLIPKHAPDWLWPRSSETCTVLCALPINSDPDVEMQQLKQDFLAIYPESTDSDGSVGAVSKHVDFHVLRGILRSCNEKHGPNCGRRGATAANIANAENQPILVNEPLKDISQLQLRVIDCTTNQIINHPTGCQYVALSYVWGTTQNSTSYPPVVSDSVKATLELGYRYLWVDRYVGAQWLLLRDGDANNL